jgi:hypothetical protein
MQSKEVEQRQSLILRGLLRGSRAGPDLMHRAMHQRGISLGPAPAKIANSIPLFARLLYFRGCITAVHTNND